MVITPVSVVEPEWDAWVDVLLPHERTVWRSHFPSLLQTCLWHALTTMDIRDKIRSVMWGVGSTRYPHMWWISILCLFYKKARLSRLVTFEQYRLWVLEDKPDPK